MKRRKDRLRRLGFGKPLTTPVGGWGFRLRVRVAATFAVGDAVLRDDPKPVFAGFAGLPVHGWLRGEPILPPMSRAA